MQCNLCMSGRLSTLPAPSTPVFPPRRPHSILPHLNFFLSLLILFNNLSAPLSFYLLCLFSSIYHFSYIIFSSIYSLQHIIFYLSHIILLSTFSISSTSSIYFLVMPSFIILSLYRLVLLSLSLCSSFLHFLYPCR